jgi:hypothetical protein
MINEAENRVTIDEVAEHLKVHKDAICIWIKKKAFPGSRHVYHVDDISYGSRVFTVIAGQVGVACCKAGRWTHEGRTTNGH